MLQQLTQILLGIEHGPPTSSNHPAAWGRALDLEAILATLKRVLRQALRTSLFPHLHRTFIISSSLRHMSLGRRKSHQHCALTRFADQFFSVFTHKKEFRSLFKELTYWFCIKLNLTNLLQKNCFCSGQGVIFSLPPQPLARMAPQSKLRFIDHIGVTSSCSERS